tara:strand:- start:944 stop:1054 length:111 start_codon:yes stop_codon:yes gene_type:complete
MLKINVETCIAMIVRPDLCIKINLALIVSRSDLLSG